MMEETKFLKFIKRGKFTIETIEEIKEYYDINDKQLIRRTFKFLNGQIGTIENTPYYETIITNSVELIKLLCDSMNFTEEEIITNRERIKKSREAILANGNKFGNDIFLYAANRLDEVILDKNINLDDLKKLLTKLIDKKEDINIIKKLLNTNKGVLLLDEQTLFDYIFELALNAIKNDSYDIYYYIALLKIFYVSEIDRKTYVDRLNAVCDEKNSFGNEIYLIIMGVKRGLKPSEIIEKYDIIDDFTTPYILLPNNNYDDEKIITIDGQKTRLRDDGLSLRKDGNNYIVGIHIADAPSLVKPKSPEDLVARNNYKCLYLHGRRIKLLSDQLENALSLNENEARNAISMYVVISNTGDIVDYYITENVIRVTSNLNYEKSNELFLDYDVNLSDTVRTLYDVACLLEQKNSSKQEYWFKKENSSFEKKFEESKSDKIVSEFMVLYNKLIAELMCSESVPYVYRVQDPPYIQKMIGKMKIEVDDRTQKTIDQIYMGSKYSNAPRFHNGLYIPFYSHSSDSLRRYPDMYNQYLMHAFYFKDLDMLFDYDQFIKMVAYFNQRKIEMELLESEYDRAIKLQRVKK